MSKKVKLFVFIFGLIVFAVGANFALAQADFGTSQVSDVVVLSQTDPRIIVGRIIQIALSFLGVIALLLIMYAGFLWMTSNGDEDKIKTARRILKDAAIGLIIILSSWAITTFILSKLNTAISGKGANEVGGSQSSLTDSGLGAIGACTVESFYPENNQTGVARNSSIIVTFKEAIKADSICVNASGSTCACDNTANCNKINPENIRIFKTELGDACANGSCPSTNANITDVSVAMSSDKKTLVLTPLSYLGDGVKNIWYSVKMTEKVKKTDDSSIFAHCSSDYFNWKFEVSSSFDLTPPQVVAGSTFPLPDNENDVANQTSNAKKAVGSVVVSAMPKVYKASSITSVVPVGTSPQATATPLNYQGTLTKFKVVISSDISRAQLFDGNNDANLLGSASFDAQGNAKFAGYFVLTASNRNAGNAWIITLAPEQLADTVTLGTDVYTFSDRVSGGNSIKIDPNGNFYAQAAAVYAVLSGNSSLDLSSAGGTKINLAAKVAGASGNNIEVSTTDPAAFQITPLSGGSDSQSLDQVKGQKDVPMNTVIQLNFSEAVNPIKVSGLASEVADYISVVNYNASSSANGTACTVNSDCKSYKCEGAAGAKTCIGDYVNGRFIVSNLYRTVEFVSDNECGVNGCGEKIYCLPSDSHLAVKMKTADLKSCSTDADCVAYSPYKTCSQTSLGYKTCQNADGNNYPTANSNVDGIIDLALNSFDGDRNVFSDGPLNYYDDNFSPEINKNNNNKDNYRFSFYVNDKINLAPPQIESVTPAQGSMGINLADPVKITWNTLMMNSTLTTGSRIIDNGLTSVEHKLINLWGITNSAIGYWIKNDNIDTATASRPLDGEPDQTITWIEHTPFSESMSYRAVAGSGIRDIYQNCYKPSAGVNCPVSETNPSCCFGAATSVLGSDGNCK